MQIISFLVAIIDAAITIALVVTVFKMAKDIREMTETTAMVEVRLRTILKKISTALGQP